MSHLRKEIHGEILHLILDGGKVGNSIGLAEGEFIRKFVREIRRSPTKAKGIILRSNHPKIFCAGGNLSEHLTYKNRAKGILAIRTIRKALKDLSEVSLPVVAVVQGDCFGGGFELVSCADFVVATPGAYFGFWQKRVGLTFGWGGGGRFLKRIAAHKLLNLCLEGRSLCAFEAKQLGLIDQVTHEALALQEASEWITQRTAGHRSTYASFKAWSEKLEGKIFENLWMKFDHIEVIKKLKLKKSTPSKNEIPIKQMRSK